MYPLIVHWVLLIRDCFTGKYKNYIYIHYLWCIAIGMICITPLFLICIIPIDLIRCWIYGNYWIIKKCDKNINNENDV